MFKREAWEQGKGPGVPMFPLASINQPLSPTLTEIRILSSIPAKNCSIFYCSVAIRFPHVETVMFSDEEFINRWKAGL